MDLQYAEGCPPLTVHFEDLSIYDAPLQYTWEFGDGATSNLPEPTHTYPNSGTYDVTLTISTVLGCIAVLTETIVDAVFVYPMPTAFFAVDPINVEIYAPTVTITDLSEGSIDCWYTMTDGGTLDDCNGTYDWTIPGYQNVQQYVVNEWGCIDSIGHIVNVEGFTLYAPNSFTPDQDGVNDVWTPVMTGVLNYHLRIYDRWGEIIFETLEQDDPWLGNVKRGDHFAQDGIYTYQIVADDYFENPHVFVGHISLLR
jgi:gliding motility-associated-like protein